MEAIPLVAEGMTFDRKEISVPAGSAVEMTFNNRDTGIPHNFSLCRGSSAKEKYFAGKVITGPTTTTCTFTAPGTLGTYFFQCDVHRR